MINTTTRRSTSSTRTARRAASSNQAVSASRKGFGKGRPRHAQPVPPAPDTLELGKFQLDTANKGNGITLLRTLPDNSVKTAVYDPEYPGDVKDWKALRARGNSILKRRAELPQMSEETIARFFRELSRVIVPSGHVFLWVDNFHARTGISHWIESTDFEIVDKIVWAKGMTTVVDGVVGGNGKMGLGSRARRSSEELFVLQKLPKRVKDCWSRRNIRDVWVEKVDTKSHIHAKPMELQKALIEATTQPGDLVLDPCAGSFSVMDAAHALGRRFIGCDLGGNKRRPVIANEQKPDKAKRMAKTKVATKHRAKAKPVAVETVEGVAAKPARLTVERVKPAAKPKRASVRKLVRKVSRAGTATPAAPAKRAASAKPTATRKPTRKAVRKQPRARKVPLDLLAGSAFVLVAMPANVLNMLAANEALWALPGTKLRRHPRAKARVLGGAA